MSFCPMGHRFEEFFAAFGTPHQNISLIANSQFNEALLYGTDGHCEGPFSPSSIAAKSSTSSTIGRLPQSNDINATRVKDALQINYTSVQDAFDCGVFNDSKYQAWQSQAQLGLGQSSTILSALKNAGHIGSRVYSIFLGLAGGSTDKQTPGSLVLGGMDAALAGTSQNYTAYLNFESACSTGMFLTINNISKNWPNDTDMSIFDGVLAGGKLVGDPVNGTGSEGINFGTTLYEPDDVYDGDLTVSIQNGISTPVPSNQLVLPNYFIGDNGKVTANTSVRNNAINPLRGANQNDLPLLAQFTLWQADAKAGNSMQNLKAVNSKNGLVDEFCVDSTTTNQPTGSSSRSKNRLSTGVIVGIAVVGAAGLAIIVLIACLLRRRSRRVAPAPTMDGKPPTPLYHSRPNVLATPTEMPAEREVKEAVSEPEPQELQGSEPNK
ncbi:hypothetical protein K469DRAFT_724472 [Zopfia rhizophila CBS 207.26]|uniref:Peptidase A1 domain-containing protein n=1 Tax=Zopfia rhizophila CBS 207.26 TaxID=1314779 RepID=A0A6A6E9E3_9PEZI|nr:hypothetical protein K469DRAFT_724472 [Zopfia rhizophila CBS 207.26]